MKYKCIIIFTLLIFLFPLILFANEKISIFKLVSQTQNYTEELIQTEGILCITKGNVALYVSTEACQFGFLTMGINLDVKKNMFIKRELYGHMKPAYILGRVKSLKDKVILDEVNFNVELSDVTFLDYPYIDYNVIKVKGKNSELTFVRNLIAAIVNKDIKHLSSAMSINKQDFSKKNRLSWIMFDSSSSLRKTLHTEKQISFYRSENKQDGDYLYFSCIGRDDYKKYKEMKDASDSSDSFCFEIYYLGKKLQVNAGYFAAP